MYSSPSVTARPAFLFDADCGVCQNGTEAIKEKIAPPVDIVPWQEVDLGAWGIPESAVHEGPIFVAPDGRYWIGPVGMGRMLRLSRAPYRFLGVAILAPGIRQVFERIGPWMYAHRDRLPGAGDSCSVPARDAHVS